MESRNFTLTTILTITQDLLQVQEHLSAIIDSASLPIKCDWQTLDKINNKNIKQIAKNMSNPFLMAELAKNGAIICHLCTLATDEKGKPTITKVSPEWHKLQRRIVTAGRKSELLLQACKLTADSKVIDATAGFGHDSLIMASGGASVTMIEQNPIMALLLMLEQQRMSQEKNWQGLMGRLQIVFANAVEFLQSNISDGANTITHTNHKANTANNNGKTDVIYLDPMFPQDSYQGAKVGKGMQVLHGLALPPTAEQEQTLLTLAIQAIADDGRVVVKRPKNAPFLASTLMDIKPDESWDNDVLRFDGYFKK